ncbi:hypothetical protein D5086_029362 [Populus alba]|uniref:Uncharacterized protein n=1 Tax=Populus alba TaxID=43335 RepID=A0ACC4ATA6_POPAL
MKGLSTMIGGVLEQIDYMHAEGTVMKLESGHYPYKAVVIAEKSIDFTSPLLLAISDKQDAINQKATENMPSSPFVWLLACFSHTFSTKSNLALCQIDTNSPGYYPDWCHQYLKPQFHSSRIHGSNSVEDDEAIDERDETSWMELIVAYARVKKGAAIKLAGGIRMILASTADRHGEIIANDHVQTTKDACIIAGIDVPRIINEPTAATIAYGLDKKGGDNGGAYGAAVQDGILSSEGGEETKGLLLDVTPLSLGIETVRGMMTKLIPRNTVIPAKKSQIFTTYQEQQTTMSIKVDEAEDKAAKKSQSRTIITNDKEGLSQEEIDRIVKEAEEMAKDNKIWEKIDARNKLKTYIYNMRSAINDKDKLVDKIDSDDKERIKTALKHLNGWTITKMQRRIIMKRS